MDQNSGLIPFLFALIWTSARGYEPVPKLCDFHKYTTNHDYYQINPNELKFKILVNGTVSKEPCVITNEVLLGLHQYINSFSRVSETPGIYFYCEDLPEKQLITLSPDDKYGKVSVSGLPAWAWTWIEALGNKRKCLPRGCK